MQEPSPSAIVHPFPAPPRAVRRALNRLTRLEAYLGEQGQIPPGTPLPWDPPTCPPRLRRAIWSWCDDVVTWINRDHLWRADAVIPACWLRHPHLANELPLLACQRALAATTATPHAYREWIGTALPGFLTRVHEQLEHSLCVVDDEHEEWPGVARHEAAQSPAAVAERRARIDHDAQVHPSGSIREDSGS